MRWLRSCRTVSSAGAGRTGRAVFWAVDFFVARLVALIAGRDALFTQQILSGASSRTAASPCGASSKLRLADRASEENSLRTPTTQSPQAWPPVSNEDHAWISIRTNPVPQNPDNTRRAGSSRPGWLLCAYRSQPFCWGWGASRGRHLRVPPLRRHRVC